MKVWQVSQYNLNVEVTYMLKLCSIRPLDIDKRRVGLDNVCLDEVVQLIKLAW
jgi:hypothetical protein